MTDDTSTDATETDATGEQEQTDTATKPTDTVEFWRDKAREQEKRAKGNAAAAKRLQELEEAQKTDAEKAADRIAKAEAEVAAVPAKVSAALRDHLVALHKIDEDDAELFLTATEPDLLLKQVTRLLAQSGKQKQGNHVPREGTTPRPGEGDDAAFARDLFAPPG